MTNFDDDFYRRCNNQRTELLRKEWGENFFLGKTVLDLGGGVGYMANEVSKWGAKAVVYEGRTGNIELGKKLHPHLEFVNVDLQGIVPTDKFDIVFNFGVFYHLENPEEYLIKTSTLFYDFMLLDGNISTVGDRYIQDDSNANDQSMHGKVKLITDDTISKIFVDYEIENINKKLDEISQKTGSPYRYVDGEDFLKRSGMKRTFWVIKNKNN